MSAHIFVIVFSLLSGLTDARGFASTSKMWDPSGKVIIMKGIEAGFWFLIGIASYMIAVRYMRQIGIESSPIQFIIWLTLVGVSLMISNTRLLNISNMALVGAIFVLLGVLIHRTGG